MATKPLDLPFEADSSEAWRLRVAKELKGKSYEDFLHWHSMDGFDLEAWQSKRPAPSPDLVPLSEPWKIVEPVYETDAQAANKHALDALMHGAEAIWFNKGYLGAAAEVACRGIDQSIAPVFIDEGNYIDHYRSFLKTGTPNPNLPEGTILINGQRLRERGATVVQELAILLSQALEVIRIGGTHTSLLFKTGTGSAFLTETAKIRALRWLWPGVLNAEGLPAENPAILATNLHHTYAQNDEHSNILRATSAAMSAVIGGAQYVMVEPWDRHWKASNTFSARISRNIQTLLKEEGRMDRNLNPADGSYLLENLTVSIARASWDLVRKIEQAGGFTEYATSGALKTLLTSSREQSLASFRSKEHILLGVNKYQPNEWKPEKPAQADSYALLPEYLFLPIELENQEV